MAGSQKQPIHHALRALHVQGIYMMQEAFSALEGIRWPVIAAVQGGMGPSATGSLPLVRQAAGLKLYVLQCTQAAHHAADPAAPAAPTFA